MLSLVWPEGAYLFHQQVPWFQELCNPHITSYQAVLWISEYLLLRGLPVQPAYVLQTDSTLHCNALAVTGW